jgi:hypothetical protein
LSTGTSLHFQLYGLIILEKLTKPKQDLKFDVRFFGKVIMLKYLGVLMKGKTELVKKSRCELLQQPRVLQLRNRFYTDRSTDEETAF